MARVHVIPRVVGMRYAAALNLTLSLGLELLNPDPDGPPVGAIAWEDDLVIRAQEPAPGTVLETHPASQAGIAVWFEESPR